MAALEDDIKTEQQLHELQKTCTRLQRQLATAKAKTDELVDAVERAAHDATLIVGRPEPIKRPKHKAGNGREEVAVTAFTDWQLGKSTHDGTYNTDICVERIHHVVDRIRRITEVQRADHPVKHCVVLFGGDQ